MAAMAAAALALCALAGSHTAGRSSSPPALSFMGVYYSYRNTSSTRCICIGFNPFINSLCRIAAVTNPPNHERGTTNNIASGKHAIEICHHCPPVNFECSPASYLESFLTEQGRQILWVKP